MSIVTKQTLDDFFAVKRLAVIGVSRSKGEYSRRLWNDLRKNGFEALPVNPQMTNVDGQTCYARIGEIKPGVDRVIMLLPPEKTEAAIQDCVAAGVKFIWLHQHIAQGVTNTRAIYLCEQNNINLITGFCPFMFLPKTAFPHRLHGAVLKWVGAYPK